MLDIVRLGAVARVLNGYAFKSKEYVKRGIRVVRITNVQKGRIQDDAPKFIDGHRRDEFARFMLGDGDILMSLTGNVGRVGVIGESLLPAVLNQRVGALKIKSATVEPGYLFHLLNSESFEQDAIKNSKGVAQLNLSSKWVEEYELPLPPLAGQKRIAGILDAADALRAKRRESLAQLDTLLQSTFLDMFGDPVTNPMGWEMVELGNHASKIGSGATPRGGKAAYQQEGIALIRSMNVRNGSFRWKDLARISDGQAGKLSNVVVEEGDVLLNITGASVARVCRAPRQALPARVNQHVCIIRPTSSLIPRFLEQLLLAPMMKRKLLGIGEAGATRQAITKNQVMGLEVLLPPREEQKKFAAVVSCIEDQRAAQAAHLAELDTLFASLQSRAFRGDL